MRVRGEKRHLFLAFALSPIGREWNREQCQKEREREWHFGDARSSIMRMKFFVIKRTWTTCMAKRENDSLSLMDTRSALISAVLFIRSNDLEGTWMRNTKRPGRSTATYVYTSSWHAEFRLVAIVMQADWTLLCIFSRLIITQRTIIKRRRLTM